MRHAVFGLGNVGKSLFDLLVESRLDVVGYDPRHRPGTIAEARAATIWWVCVPTIPTASRSLDFSIVAAVLRDATSQRHRPLVVVKSTLPPAAPAVLSTVYDRFAIVPEWLVERRAAETIRNPARIVVGADSGLHDEVLAALRAVEPWRYAPVIRTTPIEAVMVKLGANAMLAARVGLANELAEGCEALGARAAVVLRAIGADPRIGPAHMEVPGPDGMRGFGGGCLPKDLDALVTGIAEPPGFAAVALANRARRPDAYPEIVARRSDRFPEVDAAAGSR